MSEDLHEEHIHYLRVLREAGGVYQPEIRRALDYAIEQLVVAFESENESKFLRRVRRKGI